MPRRTKGQLDAEARETALHNAAQSLRDGTYETYTAAAAAFDVNVTTLRNRYQGKTQSRAAGHEGEQLLTAAQEATLVDWLGYLGSTGHAVSKKTIRPKVQDICGRLPSKAWLKRFLARHPSLVLGRPRGIDPKRAQAFNRTTVEEHFKLLGDFIAEHDIPWENIYNMDEKGLQLGGGRKGKNEKLFFSRADRARYQAQSANLQLVTVIECVCADGETHPKPGFIFPGVEMIPKWSEVDDGILVATSDNGWTSDHHCAQWFELTFIPHVLANNPSGKAILLLSDGHGSHEADKIRELALKHGIHLYCLPPHTTHRLQPLDVGIFGPVQTAWQDACTRWVQEKRREVALKDVVEVYWDVRKIAFKKATIDAAWRHSGIRPLNPGVFTDADYAPSYTSSTKSHAPLSYPSTMPTAPNDIFPSDSESSDSEPDDDYQPPNSDSQAASDPLTGDTDDEGTTSSEEDGGPGIQAERADSEEPPLNVNAPSPTPDVQPYNSTPSTPSLSRPLSRFSSLSSRQTRSMLGTTSSTRVSTPTDFSTFPSASPSGSRPSSTKPELEAENRVLVELVQARDKQLAEERRRREEAEAHATFMKLENQRLMDLLAEAKATPTGTTSSTKRIQTSARVLTSAQLRQEWEADKAKRAAKEQQNAEADEQKKQAAQARRVTRASANTIFPGPLSSMKKADLEDLAFALALEEDGTRPVLVERIRTHLDSCAELADNPRFQCLYATKKRGQKRPASTGNGADDITEPAAPRPTQRSRLATTPSENINHHPPIPFSPPPNSFSSAGESTFVAAGSSNSRGTASTAVTIQHAGMPQTPRRRAEQPAALAIHSPSPRRHQRGWINEVFCPPTP